MYLKVANRRGVGKALSKAAGRLPLVSHNFLYSLLPSLFSVLVSYVVVRMKGPAIWGEYVYISVVLSSMVLVAQWGQRYALLRDFSFNPAGMTSQWYASVFPRLGLLSVAIVVNFLVFEGDIALFSAGWLLLLWASRMVEVFYVYQKRFRSLLIAEVVYWLATCAVMAASYHDLSLRILLWAALAGTGLKVLVLYWHIRHIIFPIPPFKPDWNFITRSFPFFTLVLTGLLEARVDFFCISLWLGKEALGKYSVLFNLLLLLKNLPSFILEPFTKNLYRSNRKVFDKINAQLSIAGLAITVIGVLTIRLVYEWGYQLHYSWIFYGMAMLYVWPRFLFAIDMYRLFQRKKEQVMVVGTWIGLAVNAGLNAWWLKTYGLESVIFSAAIGQWVMLVFFKTIRRDALNNQ